MVNAISFGWFVDFGKNLHHYLMVIITASFSQIVCIQGICILQLKKNQIQLQNDSKTPKVS